MIDVGCGYAQAIQVLCDLRVENYQYFGTDLAICALRRNSRDLEGQWIQCSGNAFPFRPESVDAAICLGTLHHVHDASPVLRELLNTVRSGRLSRHRMKPLTTKRTCLKIWGKRERSQ